MSSKARRPRLSVAWIFITLAVEVLLGHAPTLWAQANVRLLLSSGVGVPGHPGFVFGPFSNLAMNEAKEIVFLSSLRSVRSELRAVVRSTGVTFSVVAFQGLRSPVRKATYESFSAPSLNNAGVIAFTAALKDDTPLSAVIRVEEAAARALVTTGDAVPGVPEATFIELSAPFVNSAGNVLFGARTDGKKPDSGLFVWTPQGIQSVVLPPELRLSAKDLLEAIFFSHDEAVFVPRGTPSESAMEQFFRAAAARTVQELNPPPQPSEVVEVLAPRRNEPAIKMLLVVTEGENVQTMALKGDPSQSVVAKQPAGLALRPLARVLGQTAGSRGNIVFAAAPADEPNDLALYCFCDGQVTRLTPREDFLPITQSATAKPILSLASDSQHTVAFIAPSGDLPDSVGIYVASIP